MFHRDSRGFSLVCLCWFVDKFEFKIFSNNINEKSLHQLVVSLGKNNSYEAISCVDNNHKMQEIV